MSYGDVLCKPWGKKKVVPFLRQGTLLRMRMKYDFATSKTAIYAIVERRKTANVADMRATSGKN
jgi:hypothetical protein